MAWLENVGGIDASGTMRSVWEDCLERCAAKGEERDTTQFALGTCFAGQVRKQETEGFPRTEVVERLSRVPTEVDKDVSRIVFIVAARL